MATENNVNDLPLPKKNPLSLQIDLSKFEKASEEEKKQQEVMSESTTFFKDGMRKLMKNPLAVGSIIILVLIILIIRTSLAATIRRSRGRYRYLSRSNLVTICIHK